MNTPVNSLAETKSNTDAPKVRRIGQRTITGLPKGLIRLDGKKFVNKRRNLRRRVSNLLGVPKGNVVWNHGMLITKDGLPVLGTPKVLRTGAPDHSAVHAQLLKSWHSQQFSKRRRLEPTPLPKRGRSGNPFASAKDAIAA